MVGFSQPRPRGGVLSARGPRALWWCSLSLGPVVLFSQPGALGPCGGVLSAWAPWWCSLSLGPVVLFSQPGPRGAVLSAWAPWCSLDPWLSTWQAEGIEGAEVCKKAGGKVFVGTP